MTTNTTHGLLEQVGAALVVATRALESSEGAHAGQRQAAARDVEQALVTLACSACDAVALWEQSEREPEHRDEGALASRVTRWRGQLDDLRLQAALAQMELRDSPHQSVAAVERSASVVEQLLVSSVHEVGTALAGFRTALRPQG